jgi:hypothetical protein
MRLCCGATRTATTAYLRYQYCGSTQVVDLYREFEAWHSRKSLFTAHAARGNLIINKVIHRKQDSLNPVIKDLAEN